MVLWCRRLAVITHVAIKMLSEGVLSCFVARWIYFTMILRLQAIPCLKLSKHEIFRVWSYSKQQTSPKWMRPSFPYQNPWTYRLFKIHNAVVYFKPVLTRRSSRRSIATLSSHSVDRAFFGGGGGGGEGGGGSQNGFPLKFGYHDVMCPGSNRISQAAWSNKNEQLAFTWNGGRSNKRKNQVPRSWSTDQLFPSWKWNLCWFDQASSYQLGDQRLNLRLEAVFIERAHAMAAPAVSRGNALELDPREYVGGRLKDQTQLTFFSCSVSVTIEFPIIFSERFKLLMTLSGETFCQIPSFLWSSKSSFSVSLYLVFMFVVLTYTLWFGYNFPSLSTSASN